MSIKYFVWVAGYGSEKNFLAKNRALVSNFVDNVWYVSSLQNSLLSVAMLTKKLMEVSLDIQDVRTTEKKILCATGTRNGSLYTLNTMKFFGSQENADIVDIRAVRYYT